MKKWLIFFCVILVAVLAYIAPGLYTKWRWAGDNEVNVFLVYTPKSLENAPFVADAYKSVLQEEGVPHKMMDAYELIDLNPSEIAQRIPALILPDYILQTAPDGFGSWIEKYLGAGGNVAAIYDIGTKNEKGLFKNTAELADIIGINYIQANENNTKPYDAAYIEFTSKENRDFFAITPGRTIRELVLSEIYKDEAKYFVARTKTLKNLSEESIYAYAVTDQQEKYPALTVSEYKKGKVAYVNLPLGYLKANSEDMLLRVFLRTFLFEITQIPHFVNVENGIGALVVNWHLYWAMEDANLNDRINDGFFRENVKASIHIAAGDYLKDPGDNHGFDVSGRGLNQTQTLSKYGVLGSLGGWAHHWFIQNLEQGIFTEADIKDNILKNNEALKTVTGYDIKEYSAPGGLHPQPLMTKMLEDIGMNSYSYRGDYGSSPNRTFIDRKMINNKVIAFPVVPYEKFPNIWDYHQVYPEADGTIDGWLIDLVSYVENNKTVRTFQMQEHDIFYFPQSLSQFLEYLSTEENAHKLTVKPMSEYAEFFLRFLKTDYSFIKEANVVKISYHNPEKLEGIILALPKKKYSKPSDISLEVTEDEKYYYIKVLNPDEKEKIFTVSSY